MSARMHTWARQLGQGICVSALLLLPSRVAVGQQAVALSGPDLVEAEKLHSEADALVETSNRRHWKQVARLLEQAAAHRAADDTVAMSEQLMAAQLFHSTGSLGRAQANLESAAAKALANGRVLQSADAYLTAAIVANERGRAQDAMNLARSAQLLARSPHLTQAQCDCILERIVWLPGRQVAVK